MYTGFVHPFEVVALVMIPLAVFTLIGLQCALAQFDTAMAALHPVNARLNFWVMQGENGAKGTDRGPDRTVAPE